MPVTSLEEDTGNHRVVPLAEQRSGPRCGDPSCELANVELHCFSTEDAERSARQAIQAGRGGFAPTDPVKMVSATVTVNMDRLLRVDSRRGAVMIDPSHPQHTAMYVDAMREAARLGRDGVIAPGKLDGEVWLFAFTRAIGVHIAISGERIESIEPLPPLTSTRPTWQGTASAGARWLAPKLIAPLVTAAVAWLIRHWPPHL